MPAACEVAAAFLAGLLPQDLVSLIQTEYLIDKKAQHQRAADNKRDTMRHLEFVLSVCRVSKRTDACVLLWFVRGVADDLQFAADVNGWNLSRMDDDTVDVTRMYTRFMAFMAQAGFYQGFWWGVEPEPQFQETTADDEGFVWDAEHQIAVLMH